MFAIFIKFCQLCSVIFRLHPDSSLNSENELLHSQHVGALSELQNQFEKLIQLEKDGNFNNLEENKAKIEADFERMKTEIEFVVEKRILEDVQNLVKIDLSCSICSEIFDKVNLSENEKFRL